MQITPCLPGIIDPLDMLPGCFHPCHVHLHDITALAAIAIFNRLLYQFQGLIFRQYARDHKEGGLHDGIDSASQTHILSYLYCIDNVELNLFVDNLLLDFNREVIPDLLFTVGRGQEECCALLCGREHVELL
ncbi:hypothetical protein ES703_98701 [subsurface metagenome]